jgi:hypothetical protein
MSVLGSDPVALHALASDLERIARGQAPTEASLAGSPRLRYWRLGTVRVPVLIGLVEGHPNAGPGLIKTSPLAAIDMENGTWARTLNRWYSLTQPANGFDG